MDPDWTGVEFAIRLQHRDTPLRDALENGPIESRRTAVTERAGVHDEATHGTPDIVRDRPFQERRDNEVGPIQRNAFAGHVGMDIELDGDLMATLAEFDMQPLRQVVEEMRQKQNAHPEP